MSKLSLLEIAQSQLDKTPVIDGQLIVCLDTGNAYRDTATAHVKIGSDLEVVSDLPLAPLAEKIYYLKPDKLYAYLGGNWTLLNDKTIDLDKVIAKLPAGSSTALNDDVEIITQDTDTTQAHYYRRKLVVIWEYIKTKAQDFFAAKNHKHKKADITDFPTSMPASDVYPWAKAAKKPSYTKAEIGLGKVDNTADADKTVKRATTAGTADSANSVAWENVKDKPTTFPVEAHNHDDRYYTEAEVNSKLNNKVDNTEAGANGLINKLESGTAAPVDNDLIITQWANHTTATAANQNRYVRRPMSSIWSYIKSKADAVYSAKSHTHTKSQITDFPVSLKNPTALTIQANGTTAATYDGSAAKTVNITKGNIGLGNVDNTADANKSVKYAANAGSANTATKATTADSATTATTSKSLQLLSSDRPTSMNFNLSSADYNQKVTYAIASANTKEGKPPRDSLVTTYAWDNSGWGAQLAIDADSNPRMYVRGATNNNGASKWDANWKTVAFTDDKPATAGTADKANSVDWSNVQNKPSSYPPASHTHAYLPTGGGTMSGALNFANGIWNHVGDDVQIGDNNTSGSFYVQGLNGPTNIKLKKKGDTSTGSGDSATITYDGGNLVIDKTIQANLSGNASTATKAISADKATSASSADKAAKLTTARTVSGGSDITLSFNYDGSGNSTANIGFYSCKHSIGNTNNYPFHRFAKLDANKNAWVDNSMTFLISQDYSGGGYGICRLVYRSNADSSSASLAAEWLVRKGLSVDTVQVAIKTDKTNGAYCDAFYKSSGGYTSVVIRAIASGGRASLGRTWTLINSNETDGTTATDKKTSSECWKTIADAGNELHKQAYSSSASAVDGGYVASAGLANTAASCTGNSASATKLTSSAGSATQPVYFKDGKPVAGTYTLGDASSKMVRTLSAKGNSGWTNKTTDDKYVPTMSFMAYWNGAYGGTSSNLQYCDRGRFGTIVTKGSGDYAAASHTHNYAGSGSAGGSANSAIKLDSSAGSAIQPVYFKDGKPVATTYTLNKTVPADAKFTDTNTWRGIQNNLTSDSTDQSLSAAQGKALKTLVDGKAPASHKHTKSQITDFPTSMPASDVSAWAKAATKPSYTKAEVGLGNVDNTADKDKSVKYATSAGSATTGLNGVSTCIFDLSSNNGSCVRFYNGLQICFGNSSKSSGVVFKLPFANDNYAVVVGGSDTLKNAWYVAGGRTTTGFNPNQSGFAVLFHWIAIGNWK